MQATNVNYLKIKLAACEGMEHFTDKDGYMTPPYESNEIVDVYITSESPRMIRGMKANSIIVDYGDPPNDN